MRIAATQYVFGRPRGWDEYSDRLEALLEPLQVDLVVFPEYGGLETLAFLAPGEPFDRQLRALDPEAYRALFERLARQRRQWIVAGSMLVPEGRLYRNRSYLFGPDGELGWQDKLVLTPWERSSGLLEPGRELRVFQTGLARLAINVCYDVEFPLLARHQARAGAELLLVPSCTEGRTGYHRVRMACQARALENQLLTVLSSATGRFPDSDFIARNKGASGFYVPPDIGFPDDGVLSEGKLGRHETLVLEAPLARLELLRREGGEVATVRDWIEPPGDVEEVNLENAPTGRMIF